MYNPDKPSILSKNHVTTCKNFGLHMLVIDPRLLHANKDPIRVCSRASVSSPQTKKKRKFDAGLIWKLPEPVPAPFVLPQLIEVNALKWEIADPNVLMKTGGVSPRSSTQPLFVSPARITGLDSVSFNYAS